MKQHTLKEESGTNSVFHFFIDIFCPRGEEIYIFSSEILCHNLFLMMKKRTVEADSLHFDHVNQTCSIGHLKGVSPLILSGGPSQCMWTEVKRAFGIKGT